jgi:hypothetical protein
MNNREIFVNFINSLFEPYKRELEENKDNISYIIKRLNDFCNSAGGYDNREDIASWCHKPVYIFPIRASSLYRYVGGIYFYLCFYFYVMQI